MYKLLVLDIDRYCGEAIKKILSVSKLPVVYYGQVYDLEKCEEIMDKMEIDILLIDQVFEDEMKQRISCQEIPIAIMTLNMISKEKEDDCLKYWIQKPLHPEKFIDTLKLISENLISPKKQNDTFSDSTKEKINWVLAYIKDNLNHDLKMEVMAKKTHFSVSHFSRAFKEIAGCPYSQYVIQMRLERAKTLLTQTDWKIQAIAAEVGMEKTNTFGKFFRERVGMSPGMYRNTFQNTSQHEE